MGKIVDITGHQYNRLTVLRYHGIVEQGSKRSKRAAWVCECECGNIIIATSNALRKDNTTSCGCYKTEVVRRPKTHGRSRSPVYETWCNMISRCESENRPDFEHYGGRGISVCPRWRRSFECFLEDMGERPFPRASLDRIDVNGNYEPGNVRWVTQKEQARNKRNNHLLSISGETKTLSEWAEAAGIDQKLVWKRLMLGWPPADCIRPPKKTRWSTRKGDVLMDAKVTP